MGGAHTKLDPDFPQGITMHWEPFFLPSLKDPRFSKHSEEGRLREVRNTPMTYTFEQWEDMRREVYFRGAKRGRQDVKRELQNEIKEVKAEREKYADFDRQLREANTIKEAKLLEGTQEQVRKLSAKYLPSKNTAGNPCKSLKNIVEQCYKAENENENGDALRCGRAVSDFEDCVNRTVKSS